MADRADTEVALRLVADELDRQNRIWGRQDHPLIPFDPMTAGRLRSIYERYEQTWKSTNDWRVGAGYIGWDGILLEEVFEALSAEHAEDQETELIQVAASAVQAWVALRRKRMGRG